MLILLGSLLGFITSAFPQLLGLIKDWQDRKHELVKLDRQMEMQRQGHTQRLEEIAVAADVAESLALYRHDAQPAGVKWVDGLRSSVRPMITYAFFLLFAAVKGSGLYLLIAVEGLVLAEALPQVWDDETAALFAAVVSFWFGARSLARAKQGR